MSLLALLAAPPLDPAREVARDWARRELSDPAYADARPGLLQRLVLWVFEHLRDLRLPSASLADPLTGALLLVLVATAVLVTVLLRTGRLRGPTRRRRSSAVLDDTVRSAAEHRRLADAAAAEGRWAEAVRERLRAVVRSLEERVVLDERPGRTADEAAREAGLALPALADELFACAVVFDDVCYGERRATAEHDARLRALDAAVGAASPVRAGVR